MYMNIKVIVQVAYMSAFRPSFCLNGSFARVFKMFRHRQTHTHTHATDHSTPAQARGNNEQHPLHEVHDAIEIHL